MQNTTSKKKITKYILVGFILTGTNFVIYTLLSKVFNNNSRLWLATAISSSISFIIAYFLHSKITWKAERPSKTSMIKFFIWNIAEALLINPGLTWFFGIFTGLYELAFNIFNFLHINFDFSFVESTGIFTLTTIVTMIINYIFYDKFVFGSKKPKDMV